ncbi:molecular chaperone [Burkholderia ubonensis]|uniref:Pilus assembly protein n=1 Tax=Burkholderia ubonensis TaxID=101571 RepID=A0AAW3NGD9_9BURK|nr:fimbria/pilus periplasmic chaperone [Burkholderia ubonensis]KVT51274.1 pilus assembly protein [Burkholderia ubonensis]
MKRLRKKLSCLAVFCACVVAGIAQASVVIERTRVIFPGSEREVSVRLTNRGNAPAFVQTWLDKGDAEASPDKIDVPFSLTPTMSRLDPGKGQTLRLIYTKEPLAQDKETLFWLNVLQVPPKVKDDSADAHRLQLAFRIRIKVLFRPDGLAGEADEAPGRVTWEVIRGTGDHPYALKGTNPTAYFVNLGAVSVKSDGGRFSAGSGYIAPGDSHVFPIEKLTRQPGANAEVVYTSINDFGAGVEGARPMATEILP